MALLSSAPRLRCGYSFDLIDRSREISTVPRTLFPLPNNERYRRLQISQVDHEAEIAALVSETRK